MKLLKRLSEKPFVQGHVRVSVNGKPRWEGPNLVTNSGLAYCATLLAGFARQKSPTQYETIDEMWIGNGGADTTGSFPTGLQNTPTVPVPPVRADTDLVSRITNTPALNVTTAEAANTAVFTANFESDVLVNGDFPEFGSLNTAALFVNEFGLMVSLPGDGGGNPPLTPLLFARVCVPAIAFAPTSGTTIAVEWTVGFL